MTSPSSRFVHFILLFVAVAALVVRPAFAAEPKTEMLWPAGAPAAKGEEAKDKPTLLIYLPEGDKNSRGAAVICRGGGYGGPARGHGGQQVARWLSENGVAACIC